MSQGRWVSALVNALVASGVDDVVLSPGSRSTPIVMALLHTKVRIHNVIDERSAAFFALGLSRVGRVPALVCTSGTAGAHYLPAIMEASASFLPLVVITADRPAELHDQGANQTTDQVRLFGSHVRSFVELGAAHGTERAQRGVAQRTARAVAQACGTEPGPVHLNVRLRKPLEEGPFESSVRPARVSRPRVMPDAAALRDAVVWLSAAERPLIAAGPAPLSAIGYREHVAALAQQWGAPLVTDSTSQLRFTGDAQGRMMERLDALDPDRILQIGNAPIDSAWLPWVTGRERLVIADQGWPDPTGDAAVMLLGDLHESLRYLVEHLQSRDAWWTADALAPNTAFDTCGVAQGVLQHLEPRSLLMVGNSNIARAIDRTDVNVDVAVLHQRGLSGIDGLIAGAAGSATGSGKPVTLVLGDISALHDIGSLSLLRHSAVRVVVVNDDGGRIFEKLPVVDALDHQAFEAHFAMAHGLSFEHAAAQFGVAYRQVGTSAELTDAMSLEAPVLIEAKVSR